MYQGQTPQSFRISACSNGCMTSLTAEEKAVLTDAVQNLRGAKSRRSSWWQGEACNLKITTVSDYKIAQAMVGGVERLINHVYQLVSPQGV